METAWLPDALGVIGGEDRAFCVRQAQLIRQWSDDVVFLSHRIDPGTHERELLVARGVPQLINAAAAGSAAAIALNRYLVAADVEKALNGRTGPVPAIWSSDHSILSIVLPQQHVGPKTLHPPRPAHLVAFILLSGRRRCP